MTQTDTIHACYTDGPLRIERGTQESHEADTLPRARRAYIAVTVDNPAVFAAAQAYCKHAHIDPTFCLQVPQPRASMRLARTLEQLARDGAEGRTVLVYVSLPRYVPRKDTSAQTREAVEKLEHLGRILIGAQNA
jgi:hypothetical protein